MPFFVEFLAHASQLQALSVITSSARKARQMICREVKRVIYFFLDGSLGPNKKKDFDSHLRLCPDCQTRTKFHQRVRTFLKSRIARISANAPDHLKTRLTRSIRAFRTEWSR